MIKYLYKKLLSALILSLSIPVAMAQTITIGTAPDNAPFSSLADNRGHFLGFEMDLMMEVCRRIQVDCVFKSIVVKDVITLLNDKKVDLVVAAIIEPPLGSPEVANFIFSNPYLPSSGQFIVKTDSKITDINELRNKTIGVRRGALFGGTLFKDSILSLYNNQLNVISYLTMADLFSALQNNKVDAVFSNAGPIRFWTTNLKGMFRLVGKRIPIGNGYCVMGTVWQPELMKNIDSALADIQKDGTYAQIYNRYFTLE